MTPDPVTLFVAPSERHPAMKGIADTISNLPEQYGCDAIWRAQGQWWGVQRKEVADFFASMQDGRLSKELGQMKGHVALPLVCIEGRMSWTVDGELVGSGYGPTITRRRYHGMLFRIVHEGANVLFTNDTPATAQLIQDLAQWSQQESHMTLRNRPAAQPTTQWGKATNRDWARHLLMGFPGIGEGVAEDIINHFGRVPMKWDITVAELVKVPGIGKVRAKALLEAFDVV